MLISLGIDKFLGIKNLERIILCDDIIGIWSQLEFEEEYPMTKSEKELIKNIKIMLDKDIDSYNVYKYGLYVSTVVGSIRGISYKEINNLYNKLPIYSNKEINIKAMDIAKVLKKGPGNYLSDIMLDIEKKIVIGDISNQCDEIVKYVKKNY